MLIVLVYCRYAAYVAMLRLEIGAEKVQFITGKLGNSNAERQSESMFAQFGGLSSRMRTLSEYNGNTTVSCVGRFTRIAMGVGLLGHMSAHESLALPGALPPLDATSRFRDRIMAAFLTTNERRVLTESRRERRQQGRLRVRVIQNKRMDTEAKRILLSLRVGRNDTLTMLDWTTEGNFTNHLIAIYNTDVSK